MPDSAGFEGFYETTKQRTFDAVRRALAGDKHIASDITQDAFVVMLRQWDVRRQRSLEDNTRYLIGIAMNLVKKWFASQNRLRELDDSNVPAKDDSGFVQVLDELALLKGVRNVIAQQPPQRRLVSIMFFLQGNTVNEIASCLALSPSTVRTQVQRMRERLQPYVERSAELGQGGEQ